MSIELPEINQSLDLKHRLTLQVALMKKMLEHPDDQNEEIKWIDMYSDEVRELIFKNDELGKQVRELGMSEQYEAGAKLLFDEIKRREREQLRQAA
ncbi:MAG: hypothetical protein AAB645_00010 [Patescibacteria group bacterium]